MCGWRFLERSGLMKNSNPEVKIRVLAVAKILNEGRRVTANQIMHRLDLHYGIKVDRKTIYDDVLAINRFIPIDVQHERGGGYKKHEFLLEE